jgi:YVTN family beta-propeller protein
MTRQTPTIALPAAPTRLAAATDAVWVLTPADNRVVRIDPATNRVVATIPVGRAQGALTVADGVVWVALPEHGLGRIDPAGNRSTVVRVPGCCAGELAAGEGRCGSLTAGTARWSGSTRPAAGWWPGSCCPRQPSSVPIRWRWVTARSG